MNEQSKPGPQETRKGALARLLSSIKALVDPQLPIEDRRLAGRLEVSPLEVSYVSENGDSGTAKIIDISRRGLQLSTTVALSRGVTFAISAPQAMAEAQFPPLMAKVMWSTRTSDNCLSGLLLPPGIEDEETWLEALLTAMGQSSSDRQRRKFVRADSELGGRLLFDAQPPLEVTVLNLSMGGALIRSELTFEKNAPFRLQLGPHADLPEIELAGVILRHNQSEGDSWHLHSSRFGPLEERRHTLLKEYVVKLLKKP